MLKTNPLFAALFGMMALTPPSAPPSAPIGAIKRKVRTRTPGPRMPAGSKLARMAQESRLVR